MRALVRSLGWSLPPVTFCAWLLWTIGGQQSAPFPRLAPSTSFDALRWSLASKLGLGALLALGLTCWTYLKRTRRSRRPRRRPGLRDIRLLIYRFLTGQKLPPPGRSWPPPRKSIPIHKSSLHGKILGSSFFPLLENIARFVSSSPRFTGGCLVVRKRQSPSAAGQAKLAPSDCCG